MFRKNRPSLGSLRISLDTFTSRNILSSSFEDVRHTFELVQRRETGKVKYFALVLYLCHT